MNKCYVRTAQYTMNLWKCFDKSDWAEFPALDNHEDELLAFMRLLLYYPYRSIISRGGILWELNVNYLKHRLDEATKNPDKAWVRDALGDNGPDFDEMLEIWNLILQMVHKEARYFQIIWITDEK